VNKRRDDTPPTPAKGRAQRLGKLANPACVYWYTVEFGLLLRSDGLRIGTSLFNDKRQEP
jgi:phenylalanine-4-hydroxylase